MRNVEAKSPNLITTPPLLGTRLVPIFCANETDQARQAALQTCLALAQTAAMGGESVLMIDVADGQLLDLAQIEIKASLGDVLYRDQDIQTAKHIDLEKSFTATGAGDASLEDLLGSLAALSLNYDWVFVATTAGCTPAHVRLAAAADVSILNFMAEGGQFMRAYWMMDAVRVRAPKFDPLMLVHGAQGESFEAYDMFAATAHEFLGAAPSLGGILEPQDCATTLAPVLLSAMRVETNIRTLNRAYG